MEIEDLDKKQLVLLVLLITFVVSIATGIVTVSLMAKAPKTVPQLVNNVIERTIEKVTTVQAPASTVVDTSTGDKDTTLLLSGETSALIPIYSIDESKSSTTATSSAIPNTGTISSGTTTSTSTPTTTDNTSKTTDQKTPDTKVDLPKPIGQGIIISDAGLILVDASILTDKEVYRVILGNTDFNATILKKFSNGFCILKISAIKPTESSNIPTKEGSNTKVDNNI